MADTNNGNTPIPPQHALLTEILDWSQNRPNWIRDAIRILITQSGVITEADVLRLVSICKAELGIPSEPTQPHFFTEEHFITQQNTKEPISLLGVSDIQGVNALAKNTKLELNPTGINLIYGDNGAGKTSYTRILKENCRCAAPSKIQPNVYEPPTQKQAKITYAVGENSYEHSWTEGKHCTPDLNGIKIFDSKCADIYVSKERETSFTPYGLSILSNLADNVCSQLKMILNKEKESLTRKLPDLTNLLPDQQARTWTTSLSARTKQVDINTWTQFQPEHEAELNQLATVLRVQDPQQRITALESQKLRITQLSQFISTIEDYFSVQGIDALKFFANDHSQKKQAANIAVKNAFGETPVKGTGTEEWRHLWESARQFVQTIAYPRTQFPNTKRCPLCQQELGANALNLMNSFEEYVKSDIETKVQTAHTALSNYWTKLQQVSLDTTPHIPLLNELEPIIPASVTTFIQSANAIKNMLADTIRQNTWSQLTTLAESPRQTILNLIPYIDSEIAFLQKSIIPGEKIAQVNRYNLLSSCKILHSNTEAINLEITRLQNIAKYDAAIATCNPVTISRKSGALAEKYVTPELQTAFKNRLKQLFGERCFVELQKTRTSAGTTYFTLRLANADPKVQIADIASEGEFRAIALAAFLAEVDLTQNSSGIVFDDPVSSLDHRFRERFAHIVRDLGKHRQTVVFTHDLFFLSCILYHANRNSEAAPHCIELISMGNKHGYTKNGAPMEVKNFKARRKDILSEIDFAKQCLGSDDIEGCMRVAGNLAPQMRKITERAVEEILFNGAVIRYDPAIHTTKLDSRLLVIKAKDIKLIVGLMDKYSLYPHDQAPDRKPVQIDIATIEKDMNALQTWVTEYQKRAKDQAIDFL
ncbi:AAA family ATPase [Desulfovibrio gilichinskyi]|uniref:Wobble nucleotide-excising tRNase n=1 Tax=Desulfovibrio gilichinskyi TaxID=1519643 RepID=A0A1X7EVM1_9BACT|nr:AAA family ATPase [Desulfovibrio gilichinskyi]SMF41115.1 Wobble nucleotide-excising tRNase [Desulfovibrio gilichinskyi]